MATEPAWRLSDGQDAGVNILADAMSQDVPEYRRGGETQFSFLFREGGRYDDDRGMTYGDTDTGGTSGTGGSYGQGERTAAGAAYGSAGGYTAVSRYERLRKYLDYAGVVRTGTTFDGVPYYRESVPDVAGVDSHVLKIEPVADIPALDGLWGVVIDGNDPTQDPPGMYELDLTVFVLAGADEFDRRSAVAAAFETLP